MGSRPIRHRAQIARRLRRDATDAEQRLWLALRELSLSMDPPLRFRRQHPIGKYVVDFACPARKLAIELDGGQHAQQAQGDEARTFELRHHGYGVIRFWNNEILGNLDGVLTVIKDKLELPAA